MRENEVKVVECTFKERECKCCCDLSGNCVCRCKEQIPQIVVHKNSRPPTTEDVCVCCKNDEFCKEKHQGRPVLVYDIPEPKFDDLTTNKRDYGLKQLPSRKLPPWHPLMKNCWKRLEVPSFTESTYRKDFTPPPAQPPKPPQPAPTKFQSIPFQPPKVPPPEVKSYEKTSRGPPMTQEVCDRPSGYHLHIKELEGHCHVVQPKEDSNGQVSKHTRTQSGNEHSPDCEHHCYSQSLNCHETDPNQTGGQSGGAVAHDADDYIYDHGFCKECSSSSGDGQNNHNHKHENSPTDKNFLNCGEGLTESSHNAAGMMSKDCTGDVGKHSKKVRFDLAPKTFDGNKYKENIYHQAHDSSKVAQNAIDKQSPAPVVMKDVHFRPFSLPNQEVYHYPLHHDFYKVPDIAKINLSDQIEHDKALTQKSKPYYKSKVYPEKEDVPKASKYWWEEQHKPQRTDFGFSCDHQVLDPPVPPYAPTFQSYCHKPFNREISLPQDCSCESGNFSEKTNLQQITYERGGLIP